MSTEDLSVAYLIPAKAFKRKQRVRLSKYGTKHGIKFKHGVIRGTVTKVSDNLGIDVLVDGYAQPKGFLAGFWEPVRGWEKR